MYSSAKAGLFSEYFRWLGERAQKSAMHKGSDIVCQETLTPRSLVNDA